MLEILLKAALYYAVRRGMWQAKLIMLLACAYLAYTGTHWRLGFVAWVNIADL